MLSAPCFVGCMENGTRKDVETLAEAAARLIGVMDARRRNRPAAANAAKIEEPDSASCGLSEDARGGRGLGGLPSLSRRYMGRSERREMAAPRAEEGREPSERFGLERVKPAESE